MIDLGMPLLIVAHFIGVILCIGTAFSVARARPILTAATDEQKKVLHKVGQVLGENGIIGLALLWITGSLLLWLNYNSSGSEMFNPWLVAKLVLAVALTVCIFLTSSTALRMYGGDKSVAPVLKRYGRFNVLFGLVVVIFSVLAFN